MDSWRTIVFRVADRQEARTLGFWSSCFDPADCTLSKVASLLAHILCSGLIKKVEGHFALGPSQEGEVPRVVTWFGHHERLAQTGGTGRASSVDLCGRTRAHVPMSRWSKSKRQNVTEWTSVPQIAKTSSRSHCAYICKCRLSAHVA